MSELRNLTEKELKFLTSGLKNQKLDIIRLLKSKIKVYQLDQNELKGLKKQLNLIINNDKLPRYLHEEEIDYLISSIPPPLSCVEEVMNFNHQKILSKLRFDLSTFKITPGKKSLEKLRDKIYELYIRTLAQPGFSAGNNGAMALGSKLTQMSLDAFHQSGAANSHEVGLKRIKDLFSPSTKRNYSSCTIHFKNKNLTREEIFRTYTQKLKGVNVKTLIDFSEPLTEVKESEKIWYKNFENTYSEKVPVSKKFLRLYINTYKCYIFDIHIKDICNIIEKTTRVDLYKKSVHCVCSPTFMGIIDIHADEEFIKKSVYEFSTSGKTFKGCEKRYINRGKKDEVDVDENSIALKKTYIKTNITDNDNIEDLSTVFLTIILENCFKDMNLMGIKGVENIRTDTLNMLNYMDFSKIFDEKTMKRILTSHKKVSEKDMFRLYYCYIDYYVLNITGIPKDKFRKFMELSGIDVLEENIIDNDNPYFVIMMPEFPDETFVPGESETSIPRFEKRGDIIYDIKEEKTVWTTEQPKSLLSRKLEEGENQIKKSVDLMIKEEEFDLTFTEIYRYGYYSYAKAYGKDMMNSILKDKLVDEKFTSSDSPMDIYEYYGIESSRLFFIKEYSANEEIKKMNPANIELLVDFQTVLGHLSSVTAVDIAKHGKNTLSTASFEQPIEAFKKAGGIGAKDLVNNIPSCLITGKRTINGTGIVEVNYDEDYLSDISNNVVVTKNKILEKQDVDNRDVQGSCDLGGRISEKYTGDSGDSEAGSDMSEDEESTLQTREPVPEVPKTKASKRVKNILRKTTGGGTKPSERSFLEDKAPDLDIDEGEDDSVFDL